MFDKITNDSRTYADIQGLEQLHATNKKDPAAARKEVAQQFEAILMQMVMHSMRDANKAMSSDLMNNEQMDMYQDFYDKQLSLVLSNSSTGLAKMIEKNMIQNEHPGEPYVEPGNQPHEMKPLAVEQVMKPLELNNVTTPKAQSTVAPQPSAPLPPHFDDETSFVKQIMPAAKIAASALGVAPGILIAQAALETNWGKKILPQNKDQSSYNLFNIKAGSAWNKRTTQIDSLEQVNGVLVKEKSHFRSYDSFQDSFQDYVSFLKQNNRYAGAVNKAQDPKQFVENLQSAGFATDTQYASKVLKIFTNPAFQSMLGQA